MKATERNGIVYISGIQDASDYPWADFDVNERTGEERIFFPINIVTRIYFRNAFLQHIRNGTLSMPDELYRKIRDFRQNPSHDNPCEYVIEPPGITLRPHQITAVDLMLTHDRFGFFLGPGSGKTLIAITWLINIRPKTALILTPVKVVAQYKQEISKYFGENDYVVTNYEQLHKYEGCRFDAVILDESHKVKNYTSIMNQNCREIASTAKYVYLFTGTPQEKSRHEILSQLAILDERVMPVKTKIFERYFRIDDYHKPKNEIRTRKSELTKIILQYTWGMPTEKLIKLADYNEHLIMCPHPSERYDELDEKRTLETDDGTASASNKGVLRLLLREITSGCLTQKKPITKKNEYGFDVTVYEDETIKFESGKYNMLSELITRIPKGIIFYEFTASLDEIHRCLTAKRKSFVTVNGMTNQKQTAVLIDAFKKGNADWLVIQSRSGNAGLDLTNVCDEIFFSLPESFLVFNQAKARINRYGQTKECNYYYLICSDTIEMMIFETLKRKKNFTDKVFKTYI